MSLVGAEAEAGSSRQVEFIDYLRVLWKYRWWVILVTVFSGLVALVLSLVLPPVWEVSMVVEPGRFGWDVFDTRSANPTGKVFYVDTAENVRAKIAQGAYDSRVRAFSQWSSDEDIAWDTNVEKGTAAVSIALQSTDSERARKALGALVQALEKEFSLNITTFQQGIDEEIRKYREDITKWREENSKLKAQIALLRERDVQLSREEAGVRQNTDVLMKGRNALIADETTQRDPLALVLYTTSLQQNIAYLNQLTNEVNHVRRSIEDVKAGIQKNDAEIQKIEASIRILEERKKFASPLQIIQEPTVGPRPVFPRKKLNVAIGVMLGLFVSSAGAFFMDYVARHRDKRSSKHLEV